MHRMAVINRKRERSVPAISTSSLPDVIFMILFFFMVTTTMRGEEVLVRTRLPEAGAAANLKREIPVVPIHIGSPDGEQAGDPLIQIGGAFRCVEEVAGCIVAEREKLDVSDRSRMVISLRVDKGVRMGVVSDVKRELRKAGVTKVFYASRKTHGDPKPDFRE